MTRRRPRFRKAAGHEKAFALVATITLMVLVALVCIGLLGLSTISLRGANANAAQAIAQSNARLSLMLAINDLQKYTGPDQRVTANAEIAVPNASGKPNMKWTGVWSTTTVGDVSKPMVGGNADLSPATGFSAPNADYFTDRRNLDPNLQSKKWKSKLRLAWLVSGNPSAEADPTGGGSTPHVTLVERSAGLTDASAADPTSSRISAPLVKVDGPNNRGGYAYWVGDESQKARIDEGTPYEQGGSPKQPDPANPNDGGFNNLAGAFGPDFTHVKAGTAVPYAPITAMSRDARARILSGGTLALAANNQTDTPKNFHDITTDSLSVLCDIREGGLKKDLTSYLETTGDVPSDSAVLPSRSVNGAPVNPGLLAKQPILTGPKFRQMGPNFSQMRNWSALRTKLETAGSVSSILPQYPPSVRMTGTPILPQDYVTDMAQGAQAIHPVMTSYMMLMDFSRDDGRAGGRALRTHIYPRITLWNPYNVTLKGQRYLIAGRGFPLFTSLQFGGKGAKSIPGDPNSGQWCAANYNYHGYFYYVTDPIDFAPGECLVFVPDVTKSGGTKLASNSVRYDPLDLSKNVLSATQVPGKGATNFFFPSGMQIDDTVPLDQIIPYGSYGNYTSWGDMSACCLKKTADPTSTIARTDVFTKPENETLQWINVCVSGGNSKNYFAHASGKNLSPGLKTYESNDDRVPPQGWAQEERQVYFSDEKPASTFAHNNIRASMVHRSPFCNTGAYYDMTPGGYRDWYYPSINFQTPTMTVPYLKGYDGAFKLRGSPFANPGTFSGVLSYPMFDLPLPNQPLMSLANLQHAQFGYQTWQPSFVLGHSICDIRSSRDASVYVGYYNNPLRWEPPFGNHDQQGRWYEMLQMDLDATRKQELNQYDSAFMVNQNLWDRYFLSSIPYTNAGNVSWDPTNGTPLPNSHLVLNPYRSGTDDHMKNKIGTSATKTPFDHSAYYLMNKGAFNINSTSVEAWRAFFSTLNTIKRPSGPGGGGAVLAVFSRMMMPPSNQTPTQIINDNGAWNGMKALTPSEIDTLSQKMVEAVKERGPFLGLADFVNRRLGVSSYTAWDSKDPTLMGALQSAIEQASNETNTLNNKLANPTSADGVTNPKPGLRGTLPNTDSNSNKIGGASDPNCFYKWKQYGVGAVLNQADFLQVLAPSMTARGDTFRVRGYGEARDAAGKITARAWCEAVVQRTPDYIVSTDISQPSDAGRNNPMEPVTVRSTTGNTWSANDQGTGCLLPVNQRFGRKMVISKFRWLNAEEI